MGFYGKSMVDVPDDDGVHVKSAGAKSEKYVYKYVKYFRNADGKPRNKAKAIGKYDVASGKMFPNGNYFELYNIDIAMGRCGQCIIVLRRDESRAVMRRVIGSY